MSQSLGLLSPNHHNSSALHITVSQQTVTKDYEENKKPYTEYIIQITQGDKKWKVAKRYKQFG